jgi:WD40 repeat protein
MFLSKNSITLLFILVSFAFILNSCGTTNPCPDEIADGNSGGIINTKDNDYLPLAYADTLYFTSVRRDVDKKEKIYSAVFDGEVFTNPVMDTSLPIHKFTRPGSPTFFYNYPENRLEVYFSAVHPKDRSGNRNIFVSYMQDSTWSYATPIGNGISTEFYESHPFISQDGKMLIFSSDRPGGSGQIDLYISERNPNGEWTAPRNLGDKINTVESDISPYIAPDGSLYFSSRGYLEQSGYDVIKATKNGNNWENAQPMLYPVNTQADDTGPTTIGRKLFLSSNRIGGCGGYDIYAFDLCGPVTIQGRFMANGHAKSENSISIYEFENEDESIIMELDENGEFLYEAEANKKYVVKYVDPCQEEDVIEKIIETPCSDENSVLLLAEIDLSNDLDKFTFTQYEVPFFVSGYYMPNTSENLEALRLQFSYNLLGTSDSTRYIENPSEEYTEFAITIDKAISDAVRFILGKLEYLNGECSSGDEILKIKVTGYADPRPLSNLARYAGSSVHDADFGISVQRGQAMSNQLLSSLRSYNTALLLKNILEKDEEFASLAARIQWQARGLGVDTDPKPNELQRRVEVSVGIE